MTCVVKVTPLNSVIVGLQFGVPLVHPVVPFHASILATITKLATLAAAAIAGLDPGSELAVCVLVRMCALVAWVVMVSFIAKLAVRVPVIRIKTRTIAVLNAGDCHMLSG